MYAARHIAISWRNGAPFGHWGIGGRLAQPGLVLQVTLAENVCDD
jgi:hypothetical protein